MFISRINNYFLLIMRICGCVYTVTSAVKSLSPDHPNCMNVSLFGPSYRANQSVSSKTKARCGFGEDLLRTPFQISTIAETIPRL